MLLRTLIFSSVQGEFVSLLKCLGLGIAIGASGCYRPAGHFNDATRSRLISIGTLCELFPRPSRGSGVSAIGDFLQDAATNEAVSREIFDIDLFHDEFGNEFIVTESGNGSTWRVESPGPDRELDTPVDNVALIVTVDKSLNTSWTIEGNDD